MPIDTLQELYELRTKIEKVISDNEKYRIMFRIFYEEINRRIKIKEKEVKKK